MRYRALSPTGDYVFGKRETFLQDSPAAVAQAALTRLKLFAGEWFLNSAEGLNLHNILGVNTAATRDAEVQQRILGTPGVKSITAYSSNVNIRSFSVNVTVDTIYGPTTITGIF
jgi:hypothetical protein